MRLFRAAAALVLTAAACSGGKPSGPAVQQCERSGRAGIVAVVRPAEPLTSGPTQAAAGILRKRAETAFGEAKVCLRTDGIEVRLPSTATRDRAQLVLGARGLLEFRVVREAFVAHTADWSKSPSCAEGPDTVSSKTGGTTVCVRTSGPDGAELPKGEWGKLVLDPAVMNNGDVREADPVLGVTDQWLISLKLTQAGAAKFAAATAKAACSPAGSVARQIAIVLDGIVESHPQVGEDVVCDQGITGDVAQISASFSEREAKDLAAVLVGGVLPVSASVTVEAG